MLVGLSGIETVAGVGRTKRKANPAKVVANAKKQGRKKAFQKVKETIKKRGRVVLKFAAAPSRNAFLLLVKLNVRGLATKLNALNQKQPDKLKKFWTNAGGNYNALAKEIARGAKKKRLLGVDYDANTIGALPAIAAAIASAAPLVAAAAKVLSSAGIKGEDIAAVAVKAMKGKAKEEIQAVNAAAAGQDVEAPYEEDGGESIEGIAGKKKAKVPRTQKKAARQAKRAPKKAARAAKKTARKTVRKAKKAPKGGFTDGQSEIETADIQSTEAVKKAARAKRMQVAQKVLETGASLLEGGAAADTVQNLSDIEKEADAEQQAAKDAANDDSGGGMSNKTLLYAGLAVAAAGGLYLATKGKKS